MRKHPYERKSVQFAGKNVRLDAVQFFAPTSVLRRIIVASGKARRTEDVVREFKVSLATAKRDMASVRRFWSKR